MPPEPIDPDPFWRGLSEKEFDARYRSDATERERLARERTRNSEMTAAMFFPWITALNQMSIPEVLADVTCTNYKENE